MVLVQDSHRSPNLKIEVAKHTVDHVGVEASLKDTESAHVLPGENSKLLCMSTHYS